jgi:hypothetical protein
LTTNAKHGRSFCASTSEIVTIFGISPLLGGRSKAAPSILVVRNLADPNKIAESVPTGLRAFGDNFARQDKILGPVTP